MTLKPILALGSVLCLAIYLFVSAPPPLPGQAADRQTDRALPVRHLFDAVNAINDAAREVYTTRVVGAGLTAGLAFGEDWAAPGVDKGPLPALFLRLAAARMETKPPQLGLYLGSDAPINPSNLIGGAQAATFAQVRARRGPVFSTSERGDQVGMYPDVASVAPCVTCHNDHPDSPRKDWVLNEVMGATTWTYPEATVSAAAYLAATEAFYLSVAEGYQRYLDKAAGFAEPITPGRDWPQAGEPALPDLATFMTEVRNKAGGAVMRALVLTQQETAS